MPNTPKGKQVTDKREKFVKLAEPRTAAVLDRLDTLGKLARPRDYTFTAADVDAIETAITDRLASVLTAFREPDKAKGHAGFSLPTPTAAVTAEKKAS